MKSFRIVSLIVISFQLSFLVKAEVKLPKIFSDNMVIQRDRPIKIWGWADKNTSVSITFNGQTAKTKANGKGVWMITLSPMSHGGPHEMTISEKTTSLVLKNILIGDIWLGSGQSNMEWVVKNSNNPEKEIAEGNYDKIRLFTVEKAMSYSPKEDVKGGSWQVCSSSTVGNFSAVAYFFGRTLLKDLDVPIGLINSSWGGTLIETWISWDVMSLEDEYKNKNPKDYEATAKEAGERVKKYEQALKDDRGITEKWFDPSVAATDWTKLELPKDWGNTELTKADGIVWFRKDVELGPEATGAKALLALGPIDDADQTYVNGKLIGSTTDYTKDRQYVLEPGVLKQGKNIVVVKVTDTGGGGGLKGNKDQLFLEVGTKKTLLDGTWEYRSSVLTTDFGITQTGPNVFPSQLYNAMIAPLTQFGIKGIIWYQGEANAGKAFKYQTIFPSLIKNWRTKWGYEFPFYWVQLANFMAPDEEPKESQWAELREAQTKTLSLPQTGQALAIDIGEAGDIHPRNKQDVGYRLALEALKKTYNKNIISSGPMYESMRNEANAIKVSFSNKGAGLTAKGDKYGYLRGFSIAGADKKFVWAKARIEGDEVVVYSEEVKEPVAVRYAWCNNPGDANLFNVDGLPACPFRTDSWPGITVNK
jgi:sialate O-acetylesterase